MQFYVANGACWKRVSCVECDICDMRPPPLISPLEHKTKFAPGWFLLKHNILYHNATKYCDNKVVRFWQNRSRVVRVIWTPWVKWTPVGAIWTPWNQVKSITEISILCCINSTTELSFIAVHRLLQLYVASTL